MHIYILECNYERAKEIGSKIQRLLRREAQVNNNQPGAEQPDENGGGGGHGSEQESHSFLSSSLDKNDNELLNEQLNIRLIYLSIMRL